MNDQQLQCTKCERLLPIDKFYKLSSGKRQQPCVECERKRVREYNARNREARTEYQQTFRQGSRLGRHGRPRKTD